ncbi:hypothetical protein [Ruminiclostridium papyrosolvens]|uniref:Uncharacterized protein n=1 Tax=Ruminiclostridium papyrosolvens C7 TaxID=1330534 RepID=U4R2B8_9FIRM|nr:hypothetical protein [Ruminiclostridium papyrosolvens]EPR11825.1 hypothetical protein L323_10590 [Ruminiclostridium papyrosolvens C7]
MSLFLGKIHYWLYNKIIWYEKIEMDIIKWAQEKELPVGTWVQDINEKHGPPLGSEPLEQLIDTSNIHGWLQERIESAELRQAAIVTQVLNRSIDYKNDLTEIYKNQGRGAAGDYKGETSVPEDVFNALNDYILEGMPCDRVNEIVSSSDNEFVWKSAICLHTPYWKKVEGNVNNFYELREAWVKAFVEELNPDFIYKRSADNTHSISRK